jgi:hypothetical protein
MRWSIWWPARSAEREAGFTLDAECEAGFTLGTERHSSVTAGTRIQALAAGDAPQTSEE